LLVDLLKAAVLGTVQGLTEFLPVSSTGHLILAHRLLHTDEERYGLAFDASLHLGTLAALLLYFGGRWWSLFRAGVTSVTERSLSPEGKLAWCIVLGTIPGAVLGLAFEHEVEHAFRRPALVAAMLIAFSVVFVIAEARGRKRRTMRDVSWFDAISIGFAQALALVPGVSRSGATISAGLLRDFDRTDAASFAFLLSAPIIAGAGGKEFLDVLGEFRSGAYGGHEAAFFAAGLICAAVVGYASIRFLLRFLATNSLTAFVVYRVLLGVLVLGLVGGRVL
jgi:undecaprenyl-diphosphatase